MGGNALCNVKTRRYNADEFYDLHTEISDKLSDYGVDHLPIQSYFDKPSFGDLDMIIQEPTDVDLIHTIFKPNELVKNGNVVSFDYKELQIDFIFINDPSVSDFASKYFAFNDLGNLIGRVAHRLGFKFGHNGLWYVLRDSDNDTQVIKEILISREFFSVVEFLGFDVRGWLNGFRTLEEIFEYVISGKYFEPTTYFLSNRNHTARVRDRKRPTYTAAVEYFKNRFNLTGDEPHRRLTQEEKWFHLQRAFEFSPPFKRKVDEEIRRYALDMKFKEKFNGENYMSWFGVEGKELGAIMKAHREYFGNYQLQEWLSGLDLRTFKAVVQALDEYEV